MFIYPDRVILYCPLQSVCHILMRFVCVYLSRSCYFVLSPPVGMSYFNGIFFVFIYPDRVILYCPLQSVCHILMGFFVFIYPDRVILYCPLQSVCHILMVFFVFIYPDRVILYCPL